MYSGNRSEYLVWLGIHKLEDRSVGGTGIDRELTVAPISKHKVEWI